MVKIERISLIILKRHRTSQDTDGPDRNNRVNSVSETPSPWL